MKKDVKIKQELLAENKKLRTRSKQLEENLRAIRKDRNNQEHKYEENHVLWSKERNGERAKAKETLQVERAGRHHAEEELGETKAQLKDVSFKLLLAEETERKRIAQEIHDGIGQHWSTVKLQLENVLEQLGKEIATPLKDLLPIIQTGIEETRRIQMNLRPALLDDLGILATISWFVREFKKANPAMQIITKLNIQEDQIPTTIKTVIYRITQEALNNVIKHSKAKVVNVGLEIKENKIEFVIQDSGQGFDLDATLGQKRTDSGLGLAGMTERATLSGGVLYIKSAKGSGTTIRASWPIEKPSL
ncbi:MAG TPA: sensor histidine kinase [Thermodesulfobacteriota bacterium]|nr:sensor histidine kinase [Thermodesulfobacteriota bacterium]